MCQIPCADIYFYMSTILCLHCFKSTGQSKAPNIYQIQWEIALIEDNRTEFFYTLSIFLDCPDKYQQLLCSVHEEYLSLLWMIFCLIRILTAQRTYAWICWNQRKNAYFCIGNPLPHIGSKTNYLALYWFFD